MSGMTLGWLKLTMRVTSFSSLSLSFTANRAVMYNSRATSNSVASK